jgi:hypothetical protein
MITCDLDGHTHKWHVSDHVITSNKRKSRSEYHLKARDLLVEKYPTLVICEEIPIILHKGQSVYLDFYLPLLKLCVEVNGEQHFKYTPYFHGSTQMFLKACQRDREKKEWCEINGIRFVELNYNEDIEVWKNKI